MGELIFSASSLPILVAKTGNIGTGETTFLFPFALFSSILINMHLKSLEIVRLRRIVHYRISISFGRF